MVRESYSLPVEPPLFEPHTENSEATTDVNIDGLKWLGTGWHAMPKGNIIN